MNFTNATETLLLPLLLVTIKLSLALVENTTYKRLVYPTLDILEPYSVLSATSRIHCGSLCSIMTNADPCGAFHLDYSALSLSSSGAATPNLLCTCGIFMSFAAPPPSTTAGNGKEIHVKVGCQRLSVSHGRYHVIT